MRFGLAEAVEHETIFLLLQQLALLLASYADVSLLG
jgi:hypothetical protein